MLTNQSEITLHGHRVSYRTAGSGLPQSGQVYIVTVNPFPLKAKPFRCKPFPG